MKKISNIYLGYYKVKQGANELLCVSEDKDLVENYLVNIRKLSKSEYDIIREKNPGDSFVLSAYENYLLTDFYGFCIPLIDKKIIEQENSPLDERINNLRLEANYFNLLFHFTPDFKILSGLCKILCDALDSYLFSSSKRKEKAEKVYYTTHPFFKGCNIETYFEIKHRYQYLESMNERFHSLLYDNLT